MIRRPSLLAMAVAAWTASAGFASAECGRFTPYGQPFHRSLESDLGASAAPQPTWKLAFSTRRRPIRYGHYSWVAFLIVANIELHLVRHPIAAT